MSVEVVAMLQSLVFAQGLEPADLERLAASARATTWKTEQTIFREGERDDFLYLVLEGLVALDIQVPPRGRVRILTVGPGELFGWSSVYDPKPKTAAATTMEPTRALALEAARLREWSEADPRFGYWLTRRLLQVISERLQATRIQLLDVFKS